MHHLTHAPATAVPRLSSSVGSAPAARVVSALLAGGATGACHPAPSPVPGATVPGSSASTALRMELA